MNIDDCGSVGGPCGCVRLSLRLQGMMVENKAFVVMFSWVNSDVISVITCVLHTIITIRSSGFYLATTPHLSQHNLSPTLMKG